MKNLKRDAILFYDGDCGLCQRSIAFLMSLDKHKKYFFAPLNGETYKQTFAIESPMDTVVFYHKSKIYIKSQAIIEGLRYLDGVYIFAGIFYIIPRILRDWIYDKIANNRKKVSCLILTKDQRFLP